MFQPFFNFLSSILDLGAEGYEAFLKKPLIQLGDHGRKVGGLFLGLPQRQAVAIYAGLLWVIPIAIAWQFESLYMVHQGLSKTEIGVYRAFSNGVGFLGFFIGGYVADFWGRHRTLILFDSISWGGYSLCMALASGKWWFVAALFFIGMVSASVPAYIGLLSEGVAPRKRAGVFSALQIVNLAPVAIGFPLLGGMWVDHESSLNGILETVDHQGFLKANHGMYWLFTVMILTGIFLRWRFLPASPAYAKAPKSWLHALRESMGQYRIALGKFFQKPAGKEILLSRFLDEWIIAALGVYASLYYVDHLGVKVSNLSIIQLGSTYVGILILFVLIPSMTQKFMLRILGVDQLFGLGAMAVLLWASPGGGNPLLACLFASGMGAAGNALYSSINLSVWMNIIREKERVKVVAASYALIKIGLITLSLGAVLYGKVSPAALLWAVMAMRVAGFFLLRRVSRLLSAPKRALARAG